MKKPRSKAPLAVVPAPENSEAARRAREAERADAAAFDAAVRDPRSPREGSAAELVASVLGGFDIGVVLALLETAKAEVVLLSEVFADQSAKVSHESVAAALLGIERKLDVAQEFYRRLHGHA